MPVNGIIALHCSIALTTQYSGNSMMYSTFSLFLSIAAILCQGLSCQHGTLQFAVISMLIKRCRQKTIILLQLPKKYCCLKTLVKD